MVRNNLIYTNEECGIRGMKGEKWSEDNNLYGNIKGNIKKNKKMVFLDIYNYNCTHVFSLFLYELKLNHFKIDYGSEK